MILPTTNDSQGLIRVHKTHDEVNTYGHLIRHLTTDKDARKLTILLIINLVCAVLEVIYGLISNSIGLLSDSAHMLFDSTALAVGIYASYKATLPANSKFSYGFDRFQTLSGLINGIFLIFIGFYIFIESLERIYNPPVIQSRKMIVVAVIGLIVNVVGVTFFHEHAHFGEEHDHGHGCSHSHGNKSKKEEKSHKHSHKAHAKCTGDHSHSHSHGNSHSHSHHHHDHSDNVTSIHQIESSNSVPSTLNSIKEDEHHHHGHSHSHTHHAGCNHGHNSQQPDHHHQHNCNHEEKSHGHSHSHEHKHEHKHRHDHSHEEHEHLHDHDDHDHEHDHGHDHHHNENLYGVFLHILADLLGSVGVITSSILIMLFDWYIADAICSAITSLLILASVVPLIKSSIMVFLQTYPAKYKDSYHKALAEISQHPAVIEFRDAHLWAYTQSKLVCSVVLIVKQNTTDTNKVVEFARKKLKVIKKIEYMTIDCRVEGQM